MKKSCAPSGQRGAPWMPRVDKSGQRSDQGLQNRAKMAVRACPETAPERRTLRKGRNVRSVHYLLCSKHIGPTRKSNFSLSPASEFHTHSIEHAGFVILKGWRHEASAREMRRGRAQPCSNGVPDSHNVVPTSCQPPAGKKKTRSAKAQLRSFFFSV